MSKKWQRLFYTSMAIGLASVIGLLVRMASSATVTPSSSSFKATVIEIQMNTVPSGNSDEISGSTFDMSGAPDTTQVTGFSVTVDQSCDLQLNMINQSIPLIGGQATRVNIDDIISGTHGGDGISLKTLRAFYGNTITIKGKLKKDDSVVGNLSMTLKL
ncbi:hypothetical protein E4K67_28365 [Desulfosporosinus fructosivorans]|uniref:Uncharacterized protein n=1 Tax=Desulfosporosinus fructosivorans TaxID=2018669 RepID=A0A4Z0QX16_9FIRM|nr:hypothetical protein [Desulfosporosinus fructosivorans]TGE34849.1 hypothetical protein E4K67_28365 [Desulfosporosinus fructosivorans]